MKDNQVSSNAAERTITLTESQFKKLMCDSAAKALELERIVVASINGHPLENLNDLVKKSVISIAGDQVAEKALSLNKVLPN